MFFLELSAEERVKCSSSYYGLDQRPVQRLDSLVPPSFPWTTRASFLVGFTKQKLDVDIDVLES
jgi:hypothetical protein